MTKVIYAGITWIGTQFALSFAVIPFVLIEVHKVWYFYKTWYFIVPVLSVVLAVTLNGASTKTKAGASPAATTETKKSS